MKRFWRKLRASTAGREWEEFRRDPRDQAELWRDGASAWLSARFLRRPGAFPPPGDRTALVLMSGNFPYAIKTEIMLALGLRLAGWRVRFLAQDRSWHLARRYLHAFGFRDIVYWNETAIAPEEKAACGAEADAMMQGSLTFPAIKEWTYRGCWLGPQVLASVSRSIHRAGFSPEQPEIRESLRRTLAAALESVRRAEKFYGDKTPDVLIANEPNYAGNAPLVDVAMQRGVKAIHFAQPARDDAFYFWVLRPETRRSHPSSLSPETFARVQAAPWTPGREAELNAEIGGRYSGKWFLQGRNQVGVVERSRDELVGRLGLDPSKKIVVVFSHILWDANLFYGTDLFDDYGQWLVETIRAACANPAVNWLVKMHPANVWKLQLDQVKSELAEEELVRRHIGALPDHVKMLRPDCDVGVKSLFEAIDSAVTVRGTVGIEAPCFGIPVFTAGTGRYSGLGVTVDSSTRDEYLRRLATIQDQAPLAAETIVRARKYAHAVFFLRPWVFTSFRASFPPGCSAIRHRFDLARDSVAQLRAAGDLQRWAEWVERGTTPDYIDSRKLDPSSP